MAMIALKANPGKLKFAAASAPNFYAIQFSQEAKVDFVTVPFQGAAPAMTEILGGRSDFGIYNPGEIKAQLEAGKLRALAVMSEKRVEGIKAMPTFKEKGMNMGDTQNQLQKKVEELTLYVIQQDKRIQALEEENKRLKK